MIPAPVTPPAVLQAASSMTIAVNYIVTFDGAEKRWRHMRLFVEKHIIKAPTHA